MTRFLLELWSLASRFVNVLTRIVPSLRTEYANADTTLSARAHIDGLHRLEAVIDAFFRYQPLWWWRESGHCEKAWRQDVERARAQIERNDRPQT